MCGSDFEHLSPIDYFLVREDWEPLLLVFNSKSWSKCSAKKNKKKRAQSLGASFGIQRCFLFGLPGLKCLFGQTATFNLTLASSRVQPRWRKSAAKCGMLFGIFVDTEIVSGFARCSAKMWGWLNVIVATVPVLNVSIRHPVCFFFFFFFFFLNHLAVTVLVKILILSQSVSLIVQ